MVSFGYVLILKGLSVQRCPDKFGIWGSAYLRLNQSRAPARMPVLPGSTDHGEVVAWRLVTEISGE